MLQSHCPLCQVGQEARELCGRDAARLRLYSSLQHDNARRFLQVCNLRLASNSMSQMARHMRMLRAVCGHIK